MYGFYGMLDGEIITNAVEFIEKARTSDEIVPIEAVGVIMNKLTEYELETNTFTVKEMMTLERFQEEEEEFIPYCVECDYEIDEEWSHCPKCGAYLG